MLRRASPSYPSQGNIRTELSGSRQVLYKNRLSGLYRRIGTSRQFFCPDGGIPVFSVNNVSGALWELFFCVTMCFNFIVKEFFVKEVEVMRDKLNKFMQGRYGADQFARFTMGVALVCIVLALFLRRSPIGGLLDTLGLATIVYTYFRMLSRNISKRYEENQKYLSMTQKLRMRFSKEKSMMEQRKTHHIYTCPGCGQKIRIPRGKGKIEIECPKCHVKFIKRS